MAAYDPELWHELFVAVAGAAAALAGLVFVAVSINVERILRYKGLPERALATVLLLLGAVIVAVLGLVPGTTQTSLGILLLVAGLALSGVVAYLLRAMRGVGTDGRSHLAAAIFTASPGTTLYVVAGISVLAGWGGGLYWVLAGVLGAIIAGVINAWVLLVEILR